MPVLSLREKGPLLKSTALVPVGAIIKNVLIIRGSTRENEHKLW
jgi:hypothetical protein